MAWWDEIVQWVEDRKRDYAELDKNVGGWLPGGYEAPPPPQETAPVAEQPSQSFWQEPSQWGEGPGMEGKREAWEQANAPTTDQNLWFLRDIPIAGHVVRGAEYIANLSQKPWEWMKPTVGEAYSNRADLQAWRASGQQGQEPFFFGLESARVPTEEQWQSWKTGGKEQYLDRNTGRDYVKEAQQNLEGVKRGLSMFGASKEERDTAARKVGELPMSWQIPANVIYDPLNVAGAIPAISKAINPIAKMVDVKRMAESAKGAKAFGALTDVERAMGTVPASVPGVIPALKQLVEEPHLVRKIPIVGKLPGVEAVTKLSPRSLADEAVERGSTVLDNLITENIKADDIADLLDAVKHAPTDPANIAKYGETIASADGLILHHLVQDLDVPRMIYDLGAQGVRNDDEIKAAIRAAYEGVAQVKANLVAGVTPPGRLEGFAAWLKKWEANLLLGPNIKYLMGNFGNGTISMLTYGADPLLFGKRAYAIAEKWWGSANLLPKAAVQGIGMAGQTAASWGMMKAAQKLERAESIGAWAMKMEQHAMEGMARLFNQNPIPAALAPQLSGFNPQLPSMVRNAILTSGGTIQKIKQGIMAIPGVGPGVRMPRDVTSLLVDDFGPDLIPHLRGMIDATNLRLAKMGQTADPQVINGIIAELRTQAADIATQIAGRSTGAANRLAVQTAAPKVLTALAEGFTEVKSRAFMAADAIFADPVMPAAQKIRQAAAVWEPAFTEMRQVRMQALETSRPFMDSSKIADLAVKFDEMERRLTWVRAEQLKAYQEAGGNVNRYRRANDKLWHSYWADERPATLAIQNTVLDALTQAAHGGNMPANLIPVLSEYRASLIKGAKFDDTVLTRLWNQVKILEHTPGTMPQQIETARQAAFAQRNRLWNTLHNKQKRLGTQLFGPWERTTQQAAGPASAVPTQGYIDLANYLNGENGRAIDVLERKLNDLLKQPTQTIPPQLRANLMRYIDSLGAGLNDVRIGAALGARFDRHRMLLNYGHKYVADHNLTLYAPFTFWTTTTAKNWLVTFLEKPGTMAMYYRYKRLSEKEAEQDKSLPERMNESFKVPIPGAPEWMGDFFFDPLGRALPFAQYEYISKAAKWMTSGNEAEKNPMGAATELSGTMLSPHLPISWGYALLTGRPQDISVLPATRSIKNITALAKEKWPEQTKFIPPGGVNIEAPLRKPLAQFGIPEYDQYDLYRAKRMLDDMLKMKEITIPQAEQALREKKGEVWDRAVQKAGVEAAVGEIPMGLFTLKSYPKGEKLARQESDTLDPVVMETASKFKGSPVTDLTEAWKIVNDNSLDGKGSAISQWYKDHPDAKIRTYATTPDEQLIPKMDKNAIWEGLAEVPSKYKYALPKEDQALIQKWYDTRDTTKLTPAEVSRLRVLSEEMKAKTESPQGQEFLALGKEINDLIDREFARLGGPVGETNKYDWITKANGGKTTTAIAKWYQDNPEYSNYGKTPEEIAKYASTYPAAGAGKDPVLYAEITALIDSEFMRLGGPAGTTDKYGWIKQANGGKTTPAIAKWYQDHPGYSSSTSTYIPYTSTYKPYTPYAKKIFTVYAGKEWSFFKKWAPTLVKALTTYFKTGKLLPGLAQKLYEVYAANKAALNITFEQWVKALMAQSGVTKGV